MDGNSRIKTISENFGKALLVPKKTQLSYEIYTNYQPIFKQYQLIFVKNF